MKPVARRDPAPALGWASVMLFGAVLVELAMFSPLKPMDAERWFHFTWLASSVLGVIGFLIANSQIGMAAEARDSELRRWFGPRLQAGGVLFFMLAFCLPLLNLVIFAYTWLRIRMARAMLAQAEAHARERAARRDKFRP